MTHEPLHPYVQVKGSATGVPTPIAAADLTLDATVELNGVQRQQAIAVHLAPQPDGSVRATFSFPIRLDAFHVERPQLLFVKVDDQAQIEGDLLFAGPGK